MADWEDASDTTINSLQNKMLMNDAALQTNHPNWPTGGTAQQLKQESNYNPKAVSPKGAQGMVQAMPETKAAVEEQLGRKLDFNNINDQLLFHRYLMNQNLDRSDGDPRGALSLYNSGKLQANNPETNNYVNTFDKATKPQGGWEDAPQQATKWEDAPTQPNNSILENLKGAGMQAANIAVGGIETPVILGAAAIDLGRNLLDGQDLAPALQKTYDKAGENFTTFSPENALNKMGVDTSGIQKTAGYQLPAEAMNYLGKTLPHQLATAGTPESPFSAAQVLSPAQQAVAEPALGLAELAAPFLHRGGGVVGRAIPEDLGAKLAKGDSLDQPTTAAPLDPNAGPPRPPIAVNSAGEATTPLGDPNMQMFVDAARAKESFDSGDLFGTPTEGQASQYNPNRLSEDIQQPFTQANPTNLRQGKLDFEAAEIPDVLQATDTGEVGTPEQMAEIKPFRDEMAQRVEAFNRADPEQLGMFNESAKEPLENPRSLTQDEFQGTLERLSQHDGARFEMPENVEEAYSKYLDTVRDDQGGLFSGQDIAKNFVKVAKDESISRFVDNHPIVKANEAKVAQLEALVAGNPDSQTKVMAHNQLANARDTLQKSRENIAKQYDPSGLHPTYRDGITYMNMGIPLPDWIKTGLTKLLQGLHGAVFKFLNNRMKGPDNLNSFGKIVGKGIKDAINKEANRDWQVKKDENAVDHIQNNTPLGKFDNIKEWIPDDRPYAQAKADMVAARDMDSSWVTRNITSQGGVWASAISKNPMVKWAFTKVNDALKRTDFETKRLLTDPKTGLQATMRALNPREKGEVHALMDMNEGTKVFSDTELKARGFNDAQREMYRRHQEVMGEVFGKFNKGLETAGLPKVDQRIAYMTSRFMGDFRAMVYQKGTKNPVGFVGHNFRGALDQVIKHIDEQNPGKYDFEKPTLNRGPDKIRPDMFSGYMNLINHFELNDPEMKQIMDTYRAYFTDNAAKSLQALQHAKDKKGIMGAEGRKSWLDQEKNADQGMKSQLAYAEHMIKWSEIQDAAAQIKQMMGDKDLNDKPVAKGYVRDYLSNAIGQKNTVFNQALNSIMDGVANATGVGPSVWRGANNMQKSALLNLWIGFMRLPHSLLTLTQVAQANPAFAAHMAIKAGVDFPSNTLKGTATATKIAQKALGIPGVELTGIDKAIYDYNQKNGVFNVALKSHLKDINQSKVARNAEAVIEANITYPEMAIRSTTFSTWVHAFTEKGMDLKTALGTAENITKAALVDYRPSERPLVYGKMGFLGDIASTLTRFKMNQMSQHQYFGKEALSGNVIPMGALVASSIAFAGVSGLMGFNYADELYHAFTKYALGKPDRLKAVMLRNLPDWVNYGMFSQLGINMQGSFSNADTIPNNAFSTLFPTGSTVADMATSLGQAAYYHDATTAKKLLYNYSPSSIKGIEENTMFSKDVGGGNKAFFNPNTQELQSTRTPAEQMTRNLAFHPFEESRNADVRRFSKEAGQDYADLRERDLTKYTNKLASGTLSQSDVDTLKKDWVAHEGDGNQLASAITKFQEDRALTANQRAIGTSMNTLGDIYNFQRIQAMKGNRK